MKSVGAYIWRLALNFDLCKFVRAVWFVFLSGFADMLAFCVKFGKFDCISPFANPALPSLRVKSRTGKARKLNATPPLARKFIAY